MATLQKGSTERTAMGVERTAMGVERTAMGVERTAMGVERTAMGVERTSKEAGKPASDFKYNSRTETKSSV